jgi:hypothetical protein
MYSLFHGIFLLLVGHAITPWGTCDGAGCIGIGIGKAILNIELYIFGFILIIFDFIALRSFLSKRSKRPAGTKKKRR